MFNNNNNNFSKIDLNSNLNNPSLLHNFNNNNNHKIYKIEKIYSDNEDESIDPIVKIGHNFIRKSSICDNLPQTEINNIKKKKQDIVYLERKDFLARHNPQFCVDYINEINIHLKETEVIY
jgi:hypothetical protein